MTFSGLPTCQRRRGLDFPIGSAGILPAPFEAHSTATYFAMARWVRSRPRRREVRASRRSLGQLRFDQLIESSGDMTTPSFVKVPHITVEIELPDDNRTCVRGAQELVDGDH
jgi:hypothetical protein